MRFLRLALLLSVIPTLALARGGGGGGGGSHGGGGGSRGGGSIGGGVSRGAVGGGLRGGGVSGGSRGGGVVGNGFRGNGVVGNGYRGFGSRCCFGGGVYLGFGYGYPYGYGYGYDPYYYGPSYYDPYYYGAPAAAYNDYGYVPPSVADAAPPTVVNQNINTSPGSFYRAPDYYLIAFTDHTIRAAASYKVEGDQIRYTTREGEERTAPLSTIDRRFSEQINRDRRVDFRLP